MKKINKSILFFEHGYDFAGGQRVLIDLIASAVEVFSHVGLCAPENRKINDKVLGIDGFDRSGIIFLPRIAGCRNIFAGVFWGALLTFLYFVKRYSTFKRADIFYVNGLRMLPAVVILNIFLKKELYVHIHLNYGNSFKLILTMLHSIGVIHKVICCSHFVFKRLPTMSGKHILENCLSSGFFNLKPRNPNSKSDLNNIVIIGTVNEQKGQSTIFPLIDIFPKLRIHVLGSIDNSLKDAYIDKYGYGRLNFAGVVDNIYDYLSRHNIFISVVPSLWDEPFGLVSIESMACSCLTLSTRTGALPNISENTGMILFANYSDLIIKLQILFDLNLIDIQSMIDLQYKNVNSIYSTERYRQGFIAIMLDGNGPIQKR